MRVKRRPFQLSIPQDGKRSDGLHLSPIIRDLAFLSGVLDKKYDRPIEEGCVELVLFGMAWEDFLVSRIHPEIQWHPGEISLNGVAMSPDGLSPLDPDDIRESSGIEVGSWTLHEAKLTMKSSRNFEEALRDEAKKVRLYLWQIRCYRHALNQIYPEHKSFLSCLHVFFYRGNYGNMGDPDSLPDYQIFDLFHEEKELSETWDMVMSHSETMRSREQ